MGTRKRSVHSRKARAVYLLCIFFLQAILFAGDALADGGSCTLCLSENYEVSNGSVLLTWKVSNCGKDKIEIWGSVLPWFPPPLGASLSAETQLGDKTQKLKHIYEFVTSYDVVTLYPGKSVEGKTNLSTTFPALESELKKGRNVDIYWQWKVRDACQKNAQQVFNGLVTIKPKANGEIQLHVHR